MKDSSVKVYGRDRVQKEMVHSTATHGIAVNDNSF
jgi:hypothetical protein